MKINLIERRIESPDVESFFFKPNEPITWKAGQFFHYVLNHEKMDNRGSDRWFTIASAPFEKSIMLTTRFTDEKSSSFKKTLKDLRIGDTMEITKADGDFIIDNPEDSTVEYVFIAGGIGITPFRSILKEFDRGHRTPHVTLLYANRDENITYKNEIEDIATRNPNLKIHYIISPKRIDENTLKEYVSDITKPIFYVSGPEPMVESLGEILKNMKVKDNHLKQDWFPGYLN